jgi:hypothetical protein
MTNFQWGVVHTLNGIELGNNAKVVFLQDIFHTTQVENFQGDRLESLKGLFLALLSEDHV